VNGQFRDVPAQVLAAVFEEPGKPFQLRVFPQPVLGEGQLLVEVTCCTICGSDLHTIHGRRDVAGPTILGHEIIGCIAELSTDCHDIDGQPLAIGDRISWSIAASCGRCQNCQAGIPQKCDKLFKYGHHVVDDDGPLSGGLAQVCHLVPGTSIVRIPDEIPDAVACPANCATSTVAAAFRVAGDCANKSVVIHGAGMLGLTAAAMARHSGATEVIVTDIARERLDRAHQFGATKTLLAGTAEVQASVLEIAEGRGADFVFDMSGSPEAIEQSIGMLSVNGCLVLVGSVFPTRSVDFNPEQIVRKLLRIEGVHNYIPADLKTAFQFLKQVHQQYPFASLVDAEFPLVEVNQAIERAQAPDVVRVAVRPIDRKM